MAQIMEKSLTEAFYSEEILDERYAEIQNSSSVGKQPRKYLVYLISAVIGFSILIVGVLIGKTNHWGTGAYYTVSLLAALVSYFGCLLPGLMSAPKRGEGLSRDG
jgi:hypothetical protein